MPATLRAHFWISLGLFIVSGRAAAQTSYPMIMSVSPVAAQTGTSSEHTVESRYSMFGAYRVFVTGEGVSGEVVTPMELGKDGKAPSLTKIKVKFTVAPDALPGVRDFRVAGPTGPSTLGQLVIARDPVSVEDVKNDTPETAQLVTLPATLCGCVEKAEDVDFYRFQIDQPTTLTFHCRAMRLQDRIHDLQTHVDPILTVRDAATGSTLNAVDNTYAADPLMTQRFEPGEYLLEVRDVRYSGNRYWNYSIEINDRPYVTNVFPPGIQAGQAAEFRLVGREIANLTATWTPPRNTLTGLHGVELQLPTGPSNPVHLVLSDTEVVQETEQPNNERDVAQGVAIPTTIAGRMESEADIDVYAFDAVKGESISLYVRARRCLSGLDSIIRILNADGRQLSENDDLKVLGRMTVQDSGIENWTVPADGRYFVEIRDVHLRGGEEFVYLLEMQKALPSFELVLDSDKTWLTPGTSAAVFARIVRKNGFAGGVQLHVDGLPDGVTAECGRILPGTGVDGCIILTAGPDAKMSCGNIVVSGTSEAEPDESGATELRAIAHPMQETYMPGGGRSHWPVDMHTVAVGAPADILAVKLSTHEVTLTPGASQKVDVEIVRNEGFDKNVTLDMLFQHLSSKYANTLPAGVTIDTKNSKTLLTGTNSTGAITLTASASAPSVQQQQCCVMANVSINFVMKATYASRPLMVTVNGK